MTDFVAAGYVGIRPIPRTDWFDARYVTDPVTTLGCICPRAPRPPWAGLTDDELEAFGVAPDRVSAATAWCDEQHRAGHLLYYDVCTNPATVAAFVREFAPGEARAMGYGLASEDVADFLEAHKRTIVQRDGFIEMLERGEPFAPGARMLGFEPCGVHLGGLACSWTCNGMQADIFDATGVAPNEHGFIETIDDARAVLDSVERDEGKEPGLWRAWAVVEYPTSSPRP